jgi:hypothetical protein
VGRPLNKRYLGDPARPGKQIKVNIAWFAGETGAVSAGPGSAPGTTNKLAIVKQVGTGRYMVRWDIVNTVSGIVISSKSQTMRFVMSSQVTEAGFASMVVKPVIIESPLTYGPDEHVKVLFNKTVRTWQGNRYMWSVEPAIKVGQADLPTE